MASSKIADWTNDWHHRFSRSDHDKVAWNPVALALLCSGITALAQIPITEDCCRDFFAFAYDLGGFAGME